mmetsp:Transcript_1562/g.5144  ORF Transcript_1562/g.5144 Transcript_1562/m.5144 type:complete len:214 (-) Transcript_1562:28-669(-)
MNFWPPNPGLTLISSTRSTSSSTCSIWDRGVAGLSTTPALQPRSLIWYTHLCRWVVELCSAWMEMMSAPALAKSGMRCSGSTIIRWQSRGLSVTGRSASTTSGPIVMFGTKRPSITSTCTQSQPALSMASTCSPSLAKLAERIDGATMISLLEQRSTREVAKTRTEALPRAPAGLEVAPARSAFLVIIEDCIVNVRRNSTVGRPKKRFKCSEN